MRLPTHSRGRRDQDDSKSLILLAFVDDLPSLPGHLSPVISPHDDLRGLVALFFHVFKDTNLRVVPLWLLAFTMITVELTHIKSAIFYGWREINANTSSLERLDQTTIARARNAQLAGNCSSALLLSRLAATCHLPANKETTTTEKCFGNVIHPRFEEQMSTWIIANWPRGCRTKMVCAFMESFCEMTGLTCWSHKETHSIYITDSRSVTTRGCPLFFFFVKPYNKK